MNNKNSKTIKYIIITGGVISGIGKGVIASSTGFLLKACGLHVTSIKIDPYLNIDAGTFSPYEHGEVFVLDDGGEVDLDLGNYERFMGIKLNSDNNITTGKVYQKIIEQERKGMYLGKTVQVVPHLTNEIQCWIEKVAKISVDNCDEVPDVCVIELGGTVGDIESAPFLEAMRQFQFRIGTEVFHSVHTHLKNDQVELLLNARGSKGEFKSKPTQASVRELRGIGLTPNFIICRSTIPLDKGVRDKISMFCHVEASQIVGIHDCSSIYAVPLLMIEQNFPSILLKKFGFSNKIPNIPYTEESLLGKWTSLVKKIEQITSTIKIAIVGKYTEMSDAYISLNKAIEHATLACDYKVEIIWIDAEKMEEKVQLENPIDYHQSWLNLCSCSGLVVPGGFGDRGVSGMILAAKWTRKCSIPFLGICLGFQVAVIEFARNVLNWEDANSTEFDSKTTHPVVEFMPEGSRTHLGGTMRLGLRTTTFVSDCLTKTLYGNKESIQERHRHRYEVNPSMVESFESNGMTFVGKDESGNRMEIMELSDHPFYVGVQYHPEYLSQPLSPSPLILGFIRAGFHFFPFLSFFTESYQKTQ